MIVPLTLRLWQETAPASVEMAVIGRAIRPARAMQPRVLRIIFSLVWITSRRPKRASECRDADIREQLDRCGFRATARLPPLAGESGAKARRAESPMGA